MTMAEMEKQGYRFSLEGDAVKVRRYGAPMDHSLLDTLDRRAIITALRDRAAGFKEAPAQEISVEHEQLPAYCAAIKKALDSGALWDVRAVYHRASLRTTFYLHPPGVIEERSYDAAI